MMSLIKIVVASVVILSGPCGTHWINILNFGALLSCRQTETHIIRYLNMVDYTYGCTVIDTRDVFVTLWVVLTISTIFQYYFNNISVLTNIKYVFRWNVKEKCVWYKILYHRMYNVIKYWAKFQGIFPFPDDMFMTS